MLLCVGAPLVCSRPTARVDSAGKSACELCGRRLADVKHHRPHGAGRACAPRCKGPQRSGEPVAAAAVQPPKQSRKRRTVSDPGESPEPAAATTAHTRRIAAPAPTSTSRKQYSTRREEQIMRLLDETHARRMAAEAAAAAAADGTGRLINDAWLACSTGRSVT